MEVAKSKRGDMEGALKAWDSMTSGDSVDDRVEEVEPKTETPAEGQTADPVAEAPAATSEDVPAEGETPAEEAPAATEEGQPAVADETPAETPEAPASIKEKIKWRGQHIELDLTPDEHRDLLQKGYDYERLRSDHDAIVAKRVDETLGNWSRKHGLVEEDPQTKQFIPSAKGFVQFASQYAGGPEAVLRAVQEVLNVQIPGASGTVEDEFAEEEKALDPSDPVDARRLNEIQTFRTLRKEVSDLKKEIATGVTPLHDRFREMDERTQKAQTAEVEKSLGEHMEAEIKKANLDGLSKWQKDSIGWQAVDLVKEAKAAGRPLSMTQALTNAVQQAAKDLQAVRFGARKEAAAVVVQNRPKPKTVPPALGAGGKAPDPAKKDLAKERFQKRGTNAGMKDALSAFEAIESRQG